MNNFDDGVGFRWIEIKRRTVIAGVGQFLKIVFAAKSVVLARQNLQRKLFSRY